MSVKRLVSLNTVSLSADPDSPRLGDIYLNTTTNTIRVYTSTGWKDAGSAGSAVSIGTNPPSSPKEGDLWYNNVDPHFYTYDGTFWVEISFGPVGPSGPGLPVGGTIGQIPAKASSTDFDTVWVNPYTDEMARDAIGSALVSGTGITITPNDNADTITVAVNNTIATKTYTDTAVSTAISGLIASAPGALDTLNELAAALGNDANFSSTVTNALATKQDKVTGVSDTEISYLDGVTSAIQTQLNTKITASSTDTLTNKTIGSTGLGFNSGANNSAIYTEGNDMSVYANANLYLNGNANVIIQPANGYTASVKGDIIATLNAAQTLSNKTLSSPVITGTVTMPASSITNTMLAGSISNDKLSNSAITINGVSTSLGGSITLGTDDVAEGTTNKYFTNSRALSAVTAYVDAAVNSLSNTSASTYALQSDVGNPNGIASLDTNGYVPISQLGNIINGAPGVLDTLNEIASAISNDPTFSANVYNSIQDTEIAIIMGAA